jgi:dTMP kinase
MILADSSAWVEFDRATGSAAHRRLRGAIEKGESIATTGLVVLEVLAGARNEAHAHALQRLLARCQFLPLQEPGDEEAAAGIYRGCRRAGETIRPLVLGGTIPSLSPLTEALLFSAARAQLVEEVIRPRIGRGEIVLCDRYVDSTIAYQGYGRGLDLTFLRRLQAEVVSGLQPRLTLLLQLPVEAGLARIPSTAQDRLDRETVAFHQRVSAGYQQMAAAEPDRWREVDASAPPDEVAVSILEHVRRALQQAGVLPAERRSA